MAQSNAVGNTDIRRIILDTLYQYQQNNHLNKEHKIPKNPTITQIVTTLNGILTGIHDKNLPNDTEAQRIQAIHNNLQDYQDNPTLNRIFSTIQKHSLGGKTLSDAQNGVINLLKGAEGAEGAEKLRQLTRYLWNVQKAWERALQLRSGGKGEDNFNALWASFSGIAGISIPIALHSWRKHLSKPTIPPSTPAEPITDGATNITNAPAPEPTIDVPTQTDAGIGGSGTGNSGSSTTSNNAGVTQPTGAETIAQGNAAPADAAAQNNAPADAGIGTEIAAGVAIVISILAILAAAYLLYLHYQKETENEVSADDVESAKGESIFSEDLSSSLDIVNLISQVERSIKDNSGNQAVRGTAQAQSPNEVSNQANSVQRFN